MGAVPPSLVHFESQLEHAISRKQGWPRSLPWLALAVLVLVAGLGLARSGHDRTAARSPHATRPGPPQLHRGFDKARHSTTAPTSIWVVVNKRHPLDPKAYVPRDLVPVGNGQYLRAEAAAALERMLAGARRAGHVVAPDSGYRSYRYQVTVYASEVDAVGRARADTVSARPGYSEHQTGWAVDLGSGGCNITSCFGATPGGRWVTANAYRYGFILRYPPGKTAVTGYRGEPWHLRYVGTQLARELHAEHVATLEQFFDVSGGTAYR